MNSPYGLVLACRSVLMLLVAFISLVACFVIPQTMVAEFLTSAVVGFTLLLLIQLAFPWHRKSDLIPAALVGMVFLGCVRAALQGVPWLVLDALALSAGVFVGNLALAVERMRATARRYGDTAFEIIRIEEARNSRRLAIQRSADHVKKPAQSVVLHKYVSASDDPHQAERIARAAS